MASIAGEQLLRERVPHSPWQRAVSLVLFVTLLLTVIEGFITMPSWRSNSDEGGLPFLLFLSWVVLMVFRKREWAPLASGVITGLYFWMIGRKHQRHLLVAVVGWLLAGFGVYFLHWPNEQRLMLTCVAGSLATAVQGAWEMPHWYEMLSRSGSDGV